MEVCQRMECEDGVAGGGEGTRIVWVFIILISLLRKGFLSDPEILTAVAGQGMSTVLGGELYLLAW